MCSTAIYCKNMVAGANKGTGGLQGIIIGCGAHYGAALDCLMVIEEECCIPVKGERWTEGCDLALSPLRAQVSQYEFT